MACNLRQPKWIICRGVTGSAQSGPGAYPLLCPSTSGFVVNGMQLGVIPRKNAPGGGVAHWRDARRELGDRTQSRGSQTA